MPLLLHFGREVWVLIVQLAGNQSFTSPAESLTYQMHGLAQGRLKSIRHQAMADGAVGRLA